MAKFLRIAHSGASAYAPANTLRSLELALQFGVDMVEFDVRRCRDALVLIHNKNLRASTSGRGNVGDYTLAELRRVDAGEGETIPTLHEAVSLINRRAQMNVDLKEVGYECEVLEVLRQHGVLNDVLISSLIPASLRTVKALAPEVPVGLSYPSMNPYKTLVVRLTPWLMRLIIRWRILRMIATAHADVTMMHHQIITPQLVAIVHHRGYRIFAWTVDNLVVMQRLKKMGIDGITSNRPDLLVQL
jgi:glycerophosphoryl diester phosphodiesterase